jgi:6-phosphogluconolactonase
MEFVVANLGDLRLQIVTEFERLAAASPMSCGLSGGPTALIVLGALRTARPDWSRVSLFWVDERAVSPDDPESNYGLARRMLIDPLRSRGPRAFPMPAAQLDLDQAAIDYDHILDRELDGQPLDLAILGVGEDGHIASLFPGHPALEDQNRVVAVHDAPKPPRRRLTLSMPFLLSSTRIWIVAIGGRKRAVVHSIAGRTGAGRPVDWLLRHAADVTIFTDQEVRRT